MIGVLFRVCNFDFCLHEYSSLVATSDYLLIGAVFLLFLNLNWAWRLFLIMTALVFVIRFII